MASHVIGRHFWTISIIIGRQTRITPTWISSAMARRAMVRHAWATRAGGGSPRNGPGVPNRSFILTCRDRSRNPCRNSMAAPPPTAARRSRAFLAVRRVGYSDRALAIAEVYSALWSRSFAMEGRTGDQHDAFSIAAWLSRADRDGSLGTFLNPQLTPSEREVATVEGWILGMRGLIRSRRSSLRDE